MPRRKKIEIEMEECLECGEQFPIGEMIYGYCPTCFVDSLPDTGDREWGEDYDDDDYEGNDE